MGAFLDKPLTEKTTHTGKGQGLSFAVSAMQGWRVNMEDAHILEGNVDKLQGCGFFAVFDGHGGKTVAEESATRLVPIVVDEHKSSDASPDALAESLKRSLFRLDDDLRTIPNLGRGVDRSGATALVCAVTAQHIIIANAGDSRAVFVRDGQVSFATADHKPSNAAERQRILQADGFVEMGRVCGNLAVSRALGDFMYKDKPSLPPAAQKVSCEPDVEIIRRQETDEFLVLACDGIWDVMSNEEVAQFVTDHLKAGVAPDQIAERLLDHCLGLESKDNMSAVIVLFPSAPAAVPGCVPPKLALEEQQQQEAQAQAAAENTGSATAADGSALL